MLALHPARVTDLPAIAALMNRAYRGTGEAAGWNSEAHLISGDRTTPDLLTADLAAKPHSHLLVVEHDPAKSPHGCVWLEPVSTSTWYLGLLTVDPALQNAGLGRALLEAAEHFATARGAQSVRMTVVSQRDTLISWYERRGYRRTGALEPFPYDDPRFGTPRCPGLNFVVLEKSMVQDPAPSVEARGEPAAGPHQTAPARK